MSKIHPLSQQLTVKNYSAHTLNHCWQKRVSQILMCRQIANRPYKNPNKIFVRSKEGIYVKEYSKVEYDERVQVRTVAQMINLLLMKKNIKERLIEIGGIGNIGTYGLFEPEKLKLFFDKYSVDNYELDKVSRLMK